MKSLVLAVILTSSLWAQELDGSKIFTTGTNPQEPGTFSLSLQYLTANAHTEFLGGGGRQLLGGSRNTQLSTLSVSAGLVEDLDLTINAGLNNLRDNLQEDPDEEDFIFGSGSARGSGLTNFNANLRYRFWQDQEEGRSLAFSTGPAFNANLQKLGSNYQINGSFVAWQQSLLFRQDFDPFVGNVEIYYSFPVNPGAQTYRQFSTNLAVGWNALDWLLPVVELNYSSLSPTHNDPIENLAVTAGVILKPEDDLSFTLGVQKAVAGRNTETYTGFTLGTSVNF